MLENLDISNKYIKIDKSLATDIQLVVFNPLAINIDQNKNEDNRRVYSCSHSTISE